MLQAPVLCELKQRFMQNLIPDGNCETSRWAFNNRDGAVVVNCSRGDVYEKVCISEITATVVIPERDHHSTIQWLGVQTFPKNPHVPLFCGVFENVMELDGEKCPCFFDVYPVIPCDEDAKSLREGMGAVCSDYGRRYPDLPEGYKKMFRVEHPGIGVGYAAGLALGPEESDSSFFKEAACRILELYVPLAEKHCCAVVTDDDKKAQQAFRREWVRYTFMENRFFQGGVGLGIPAESFMQHMLPPIVTF